MILQQTFVAKNDQLITYNVGRDEIGLVSQEIKAGEVIKGQLQQDGTIRYNSIHRANEKNYVTPIFLNPEDFSIAMSVESEPLKINKGEMSSIVILVLGLSFGLLIAGRK